MLKSIYGAKLPLAFEFEFPEVRFRVHSDGEDSGIQAVHSLGNFPSATSLEQLREFFTQGLQAINDIENHSVKRIMKLDGHSASAE